MDADPDRAVEHADAVEPEVLVAVGVVHPELDHLVAAVGVGGDAGFGERVEVGAGEVLLDDRELPGQRTLTARADVGVLEAEVQVQVVRGDDLGPGVVALLVPGCVDELVAGEVRLEEQRVALEDDVARAAQLHRGPPGDLAAGGELHRSRFDDAHVVGCGEVDELVAGLHLGPQFHRPGSIIGCGRAGECAGQQADGDEGRAEAHREESLEGCDSGDRVPHVSISFAGAESRHSGSGWTMRRCPGGEVLTPHLRIFFRAAGKGGSRLRAEGKRGIGGRSANRTRA